MRPTVLIVNQTPGIIDASPSVAHLLELPLNPLVRNHCDTMHAAVQFPLAEAASAERLRRDYAHKAGEELVVVRGVSVKYRHPSTITQRAFAQVDPTSAHHPAHNLATRSRTIATVCMELKDFSGNLTFSGSFDWSFGRMKQFLV